MLGFGKNIGLDYIFNPEAAFIGFFLADFDFVEEV